jgi:4-aminobutyrate aminotransferase/(S)-3-amino-2-methylpropionate transaminase
LSSEELLQKDAQHVIRAWTGIAEPTPVVEGRGAILVDPEGREYIDCSSGLFAVNVGHSHPEVVAAIKDQVEKVIQVSALQVTEPMVRLAERVAQLTPAPLQKSYFTTGGGESVEIALKMARQYTGKYETIVLKNAFHGLGFGSGAATGATSYKRGFGPLLYGFLRAPHAYCYRCPFELTFPACDLRCAQEIENIITDTAICTVADGSINAVLVEPVQGRGGIIPPDDWLPRVREICDRHGVLLILDEIQTGFGRTGQLFAFEHRGVVPDILVLSKNVGGGIPAGVVMPREEIAEDFRTGTTPTHSGNALACRAGLAALEVLVRERLWENAARMGQRFEDGFESMRTSRYVGEARLKGLMGGVELVQDRETKEPLSREAVGRIKEALLRRFIITSASGPHGNVFRVQPPLVVTADQVDRVVSAFDDAIEEVIGA